MFGFALKHKCCLCGRLIWDVDLFLGPFPQGADDFPGCGGQGAGPGSMSGGCSAVHVRVRVSLPALQLAVPCEGGWLVLVPATLHPGFYTLAKAKRRSA